MYNIFIFEGNSITTLYFSHRKCKKIAKIFACGELNLLNFEQVNPVSPKMYNLNLKERLLLLDPEKQFKVSVSLFLSKILYPRFKSLLKLSSRSV